MQHAHDRQVLHRDVKPSNVLVGTDGLPMLLDFNLAQEPLLASSEAAHAGVRGTLAYMAPEQLESLAEAGSIHVDARSDLYAFGVVLFDCLVRGTRSFALPSNSLTMTEGLLRTAELGARAFPGCVRPTRTCLRPSRPSSAAAWPRTRSIATHRRRSSRPISRRSPMTRPSASHASRSPAAPSAGSANRRRLAVAAPLVLALGIAAYSLGRPARRGPPRSGGQILVRHRRRRPEGTVRARLEPIRHGHSARRRRLPAARIGRADQGRGPRARQNKEFRDKADDLFEAGERLRFSLLGFSGDSRAACR